MPSENRSAGVRAKEFYSCRTFLPMLVTIKGKRENFALLAPQMLQLNIIALETLKNHAFIIRCSDEAFSELKI